jgi:hypothetical protein
MLVCPKQWLKLVIMRKFAKSHRILTSGGLTTTRKKKRSQNQNPKIVRYHVFVLEISNINKGSTMFNHVDFSGYI